MKQVRGCWTQAYVDNVCVTHLTACVYLEVSATAGQLLVKRQRMWFALDTSLAKIGLVAELPPPPLRHPENWRLLSVSTHRSVCACQGESARGGTRSGAAQSRLWSWDTSQRARSCQGAGAEPLQVQGCPPHRLYHLPPEKQVLKRLEGIKACRRLPRRGKKEGIFQISRLLSFPS